MVGGRGVDAMHVLVGEGEGPAKERGGVSCDVFFFFLSLLSFFRWRIRVGVCIYSNS